MIMKRSNKEIKAEIKRLDKIKDKSTMGADRAYDKIEALEECLTLDEFDINDKIEDLVDTDYDIYAVYDWAVKGRDNF